MWIENFSAIMTTRIQLDPLRGIDQIGFIRIGLNRVVWDNGLALARLNFSSLKLFAIAKPILLKACDEEDL